MDGHEVFTPAILIESVFIDQEIIRVILEPGEQLGAYHRSLSIGA